jgi:hypothetical protein
LFYGAALSFYRIGPDGILNAFVLRPLARELVQKGIAPALLFLRAYWEMFFKVLDWLDAAPLSYSCFFRLVLGKTCLGRRTHFKMPRRWNLKKKPRWYSVL